MANSNKKIAPAENQTSLFDILTKEQTESNYGSEKAYWWSRKTFFEGSSRAAKKE